MGSHSREQNPRLTIISFSVVVIFNVIIVLLKMPSMRNKIQMRTKEVDYIVKDYFLTLCYYE